MICKAPQALNRGGWYHLSFAPENGPLTVHKTRYDKHDLYSPAGKGVQFHPAPQFPFEAPTFQPLSNEGRCCMPLSCAGRSCPGRTAGRTSTGGSTCTTPSARWSSCLLRCGRQKAVNTLRELQYAGLVEIQKQGCGKPNRIYPKSYEAVPNTDFKKSGYGTPEG